VEIKPKQGKNKKYMLIRYGRMDIFGWFEHNETSIPRVPRRVVIKTDRGLELGHLVGQCCAYRAGMFRWSPDQVEEYFEDSDVECAWGAPGKFVRYATAEDLSEERHLEKIAKEEMKTCVRFVEELGLPMKIVDAEHLFGGERLVFYFVADGRVDFRQLVKKLAQEYQTRIEMRQIGSRDEAKLLADVESCGQECCCRKFLKTLKPVNMRMAKMQKATLDPSKISGYCGRLKCCLRYEDKTYSELKKRLPRKNAKVTTRHGRGKVVDTQVLTQLVMVETDDGTRVAVPVEELEIIAGSPTREDQKQDPADKGDNNASRASRKNRRNSSRKE